MKLLPSLSKPMLLFGFLFTSQILATAIHHLICTNENDPLGSCTRNIKTKDLVDTSMMEVLTEASLRLFKRAPPDNGREKPPLPPKPNQYNRNSKSLPNMYDDRQKPPPLPPKPTSLRSNSNKFKKRALNQLEGEEVLEASISSTQDISGNSQEAWDGQAQRIKPKTLVLTESFEERYVSTPYEIDKNPKNLQVQQLLSSPTEVTLHQRNDGSDDEPEDVHIADASAFARPSEDMMPLDTLSEEPVENGDDCFPLVPLPTNKANIFKTTALLHYKPVFQSPEGSSTGDVQPEQELRTPSGTVIFLDSAAIQKPVNPNSIEGNQTASFTVRSQLDGLLAVGVADRLVSSERTLKEESKVHLELCEASQLIYEYSKSNIRASGLLDTAYRRLLSHETDITGSAAAAFGIISRYGKVSVSMMGNSGAVLYRDGKMHQTEVVLRPEGEQYAMLPNAMLPNAMLPNAMLPNAIECDDRGCQSGIKTSHSFSSKLNYDARTHTGDVWLFALGDVMRFTKPSAFTDFIRLNRYKSAKELADQFLEIVVENIRKKQTELEETQPCSCFPCLRTKITILPTDVSLVIVKVL